MNSVFTGQYRSNDVSPSDIIKKLKTVKYLYMGHGQCEREVTDQLIFKVLENNMLSTLLC